MNIYDFDNTIFKGDSSHKFIRYSFLRHPFLLIWSSLKSFKEVIKCLFKKSNLGLIKSELFSFVKYIKNFDEYVNMFILKQKKNIKGFYLEKKQTNDVIISASFEFIIKPFCESLGIKNVIATKYDIKKGHIIGLNCKGKEKVKRFKKLYSGCTVDKAYSDSLNDLPMLNLANKAYLVKNNRVIKLRVYKDESNNI